MPDSSSGKKPKHSQSRKRKKANKRGGQPQLKKKPKRKEKRAEALQAKAQGESQRTELDECGCPRWRRVLRWIRRHDKEIGVILAFFAIVVAAVGPIVKGFILPPPDPPPATTVIVDPVGFISEVKQNGTESWANAVEVSNRQNRVAARMRVENTASQPLTGLVGRARLPTAFSFNGRCRYGVNQAALTPCSGSPLVDGGISLPNLQSGEWLYVLFEVDIPADIPGSNYVIGLSISSNQTGEIEKTNEVKVALTEAEKVVRGLFTQTEGDRKFWHGQPEMAPRSKRLLIRKWSQLALEEVHRFGQVPGGRTVSLAELFYNHTHEGRVVELRARVSSTPSVFPKSARIVKQSYEVVTAGKAPHLHCYTWRPADHLLEKGDELRIKVIPIAWSPNGGGTEMTMGVCPAARIIRAND